MLYFSFSFNNEDRQYRKELMKLKLMGILAVLLTVFYSKDVLAYQETIYQAEKIAGVKYYKKIPDETSTFKELYEEVAIYRKSSDNSFVYSLNASVPLESLENNYDSKRATPPDYLDYLKKERLESLLYYGYGYKDDFYDHTEPKWYAVTQYLIWQTISPEIVYSFTSDDTSNVIEPFNAEIQELEAIIYMRTAKPSIVNFSNNRTILVGDTKTITIEHRALDTFYNIYSNEMNVNIIEDGQIELSSLTKGQGKLIFEDRYEMYNKEIAYYQNNEQDLVEQGDKSVHEQYFYFDINAGEFQYTSMKTDDTYNTYRASGIPVLLYNKNTNELIATKVTNENGVALFENLQAGDYYALEDYDNSRFLSVTNPEFTISSERMTVTHRATYRLQNLKLNLKFMVEDYEFLPNDIRYYYTSNIYTDFGLFDENDNLIMESYPNEEGIVSFSPSIGEGKYYIKQLNTTSNNIIDENKYYFDFIRQGEDKTQVINELCVIKNDLKKGILNIKVMNPLNEVDVSDLTITLVNADNVEVSELKPDINGEISIILPQGVYTLKNKDLNIDYTLLFDTKVIEIGNLPTELTIESNKKSDSDEKNNDSVNPEGPTEPEYPDEPVEPTEPEVPAEPGESIEPIEPENPDDALEPTEPENPDEPVEPTIPEVPVEPVEPAKPEVPAEPGESIKPTDSVEPPKNDENIPIIDEDTKVEEDEVSTNKPVDDILHDINSSILDDTVSGNLTFEDGAFTSDFLINEPIEVNVPATAQNSLAFIFYILSFLGLFIVKHVK